MSAALTVAYESPRIRTASGGYFTFLSPRSSDVHIGDIAASLSRLCRYTGQLPDPDMHYSVAQHSVLVSHITAPEYALWGLLHDAAEAYIGDVNSPLKSLLQDYRQVEHRVEQCVWGTFGLRGSLPMAVKKADRLAFEMEYAQFFNDGYPHIVPLERREARILFLERAYELGLI